MSLLGRDYRVGAVLTDTGHDVEVFPNGDGWWVWVCDTKGCEHTGYGTDQLRIHRAAQRHVKDFDMR